MLLGQFKEYPSLSHPVTLDFLIPFPSLSHLSLASFLQEPNQVGDWGGSSVGKVLAEQVQGLSSISRTLSPPKV